MITFRHRWSIGLDLNLLHLIALQGILGSFNWTNRGVHNFFVCIVTRYLGFKLIIQ